VGGEGMPQGVASGAFGEAGFADRLLELPGH
jgi:hypothetical protein